MYGRKEIMSRIKRTVAAFTAVMVICASVLNLNVPKSAHAEGGHTLVMHFEDFNGESPLRIDVGPGVSADYALRGLAYENYGSTIKYPEPVNGKAIVDWKTEDSDVSFDFSGLLTEDVDIYPALADTVDAGTIDITVDESVFPTVGAAIPKDFKDKVTVPDGFVVEKADYCCKEDGTVFENDRYYFLSVVVRAEDGKTFNYSYDEKNELTYSVDGATINGKKANTYWPKQILKGNTVEADLPFVLGNPETSTLTIHYNGHGGQEDKSVEVPNDFYFAPEMLLDKASGEGRPREDGYVFMGWYGDPEFTMSYTSALGDNVALVNGNIDYYAKWGKLIDEVNLTVEVPICGEEVKLANGGEISPELLRTELQYARLSDHEDAAAAPLEMTNEPAVSCETPGIDASAAWITSETPVAEIRYDTMVQFFMGTIYGENDYTFVISCDTSNKGEPVWFSKNLKVYVNGDKAKDYVSVDSSNMRTMSLFGVNLRSFRSSKVGKTSDTGIVTKGGNSFAVIGTVTADHDWDDGVITKKPGCEDKGIKTFSCRIKDASYDEEVDAYGHAWLEWKVIKPATETEEGLEKRVCSNNGEHMETRVIPKSKAADVPVNTDTNPPESKNQSNTGDDTALVLKVLIMLSAAVLFTYAAVKKKKER